MPVEVWPFVGSEEQVSIVVSAITVILYAVGFVCSLFALWRSRTPQGATAWVVGLLSFPLVVIPFFLIFGRSKFRGRVKERKKLEQEAQRELSEIDGLYKQQMLLERRLRLLMDIVDPSQRPCFTDANEIQLLVDGEQTYVNMFQGIESAERYILLQSYIFRDDKVGRQFVDLLKKRAREGIRVYFLCDRVGSSLKGAFLREMEDVGIQVGIFQSWKSWSSRFQINFRNHRKVLVVDGRMAFVGGLNIGDDYLGRWKNLGPWRDTHVRLVGPAALAAQLSFVKDWFWVKEHLPDLDWIPHRVAKGGSALVLHTGPADERENCLLVHLAFVNSAAKRIWLANPYLVPPEGLINALELASLRGVDVRILLPSYSDNILVHLASEVYMEKLIKSGVKFYKYKAGFLHQKVILVDEAIAVVGSVNLDQRSFFINFEILAASTDAQFIMEVEQMLQRDLQHSSLVHSEDLLNRPLWRQIISRAANLMSPML